MKKFIKKIALFASIMLVIISICELMIRHSENEYIYKHKYISKHGDRVECVVLGTSRSYFGVSPHLFSRKTFILANSDQQLKVDAEMLNRYSDNLSNLKTVILELSYPTIRRGVSSDKLKYIDYQIFMGFNAENMCCFRNNFMISNKPHFVGYMSRIIMGESMQCDSLGLLKHEICNQFQVKRDGLINLDSDGANLARSQTNKSTASVDINVETINSMATYCRDRSIRFILVTVPVWHTLYENLDPEQYQEMQSIISNIVTDNDIEYYNYINDSRFYKETDYFLDAHHLSRAGADKFGAILADTLDL